MLTYTGNGVILETRKGSEFIKKGLIPMYNRGFSD